jgi:hypothetical protein
MGLIAICVVSLLGASASVWRQEQGAVGGVTSKARTQSFLERTLRASHEVGYWASGEGAEAPALLLWAHDLRSKQTSEVRDHEIQACEMLLVRYDAAAKKLRLYVPIDWTSMTSAEQTEAGETITAASFAAKATADAFMARSWVQTHVLSGAAEGELVTAMWVDVDRTGANPVVRFRIDLVRDGQTQALYGVVRLRVASDDDDWSPLVLQKAPVQGTEPDPFGF